MPNRTFIADRHSATLGSAASILNRISEGLDRILRHVVVVFMLVLVISVGSQVVCRYLLHLAFPSSEEIATDAFIWLTFLGATIGFRDHSLPVLTIVTDMLPAKRARQVEMFGLGCTAFFLGFLVLRGTKLTFIVATQLSPMLELSMAWIYVVLPIASGVMLIHLFDFVLNVKGPRWNDLPATILAIGGLWVITQYVDLKSHVYLVMVVTLIVFMAARIPIAVALGLTTIVGTAVSGFPDITFINRMLGGLNNFTLLAVPLFLLTGAVMATGSLAQRLVDFANSLVGWIRGGLAISDVLVSALFADISGSAVADTAAIGSVMIPNMIKRGYDVNFTTALQTSAGSLGMQFPPSISMLLYAWVAGVSTAALFAASFLPACLVGLSFAAVAYITAYRRKYPRDDRFRIALVASTFRRCIFALFTPIIIIGGILSGAFTATEAGVVAVFYSAIVAMFVYRDVSGGKFMIVVAETASAVARITFLVGTAIGMSWIVIVNQGPQELAGTIHSISSNPLIVLLLVNVFVILLGMFLEPTAILLIVVPVILPVLLSVGVDPVVFGVIFVTNCALGMIHPPVGLCLFVACGISGAKIEQVSLALIPFMMAKIGDIVLLSIFPGIALFLPRWLGIY